MRNKQKLPLKYDSILVPSTREYKKEKSISWGAGGGIFGIVGMAGWASKTSDYGGLFLLVGFAGVLYFGVNLIEILFGKTHWQLTPKGEAQRSKKIGEWKSLAVGTFWLCIGAIVIFYFWTPLTDSLENRITVYPESCLMDANGVTCPWRPEKPETFIVHVDQQLVIAILEDAVAPVKLHNCVVADRVHWTCALGPENYSSTITMKGDEFIANGHYVSRTQWLKDHLN